VDVLPGLKAGASTPPDGSAVAPVGPRPFLPALNGGVPRAFLMDFALDGVKWWSLVILAGYSRTIVAGAMAPTEATWAALMVLYTACMRYGVPEALMSDSGGA